MTKTEQFRSLLQHGTLPEKVLFRPILMYFAARFIGKTYGEFASDYHVLVEANLRCMDEFDLDMVGLISDPYRETSAFGAKIQYIPDGVPRCLNYMVESMDDVTNLKNPDVYKAERTRDRIKAGEVLSKKTQGNVPIIGWIEGPLAEACDLAGVQNIMMQLMMEPDFANRLMDRCMVTAKDFAKAQIEAGCEIIGMGDAVCSQIDAETYETFIKERHKELIEFIHSLGGKIKLHICGDTNHLLPHYKDLNLDVLDLDWQVDISHARSVLGDTVILAGNINPVLVQDKSRDEVFSLCRSLVEKHKNERFILSAGCEITVLTPPENLKAMDEARINPA
ncbi:uroporphyrinogen decarboxylase family protein [Mariniphaga sp.]|uniref:uroporphyrinogen decarboxylase family protein n=1 Tax=Mariniphaga sp. TaxID=1954475 RepID=UPI0035662644